MNKRIIFFFGLMLYYNLTVAQFKIGIVGGSSIAYTTSRVYTADYKYTFHLGISANLKVRRNVKLDIGLLYAEKGNDNQNTPLRLQYISVPVVGSYTIFKKVNLLFGPELNYLLNGIYIVDPLYRSQTYPTIFRKFDAGLLGG